MMKVLLYPDNLLKMKSAYVDVITHETKILCEEMYKTMKHNNGVGLAAPQVGILQRIVVIQVDNHEKPIFMINPKITARSEQQIVFDEGCLSLPGVRADVVRSESIKFRYTNLDCISVEQIANDLLAVCVQHELDHLDGKLFIDRLSKKRRSIAIKAFFAQKKEAICQDDQ